MPLRLTSGLQISGEWERLEAFLAEEWAYYDGIPDTDPMHILPLDTMVPVMVNAYWAASAGPLRRMYRAMAAACDPLLSNTPAEADLATANSSTLGELAILIDAACRVEHAGLAIATKVLLRKRPRLIPMLDSVIKKHYLAHHPYRGLGARLDDPARRVTALLELLTAVQVDLVGCLAQLTSLSNQAASRGWPISPLRAMEILIWTEVEPQGYYRGGTIERPDPAPTSVEGTG
jgi:hypothetical protein